MDGVLGGYGHVNTADIKASEDFLNTILAERFPDAGTGRRLVALGTASILFYLLISVENYWSSVFHGSYKIKCIS